MQEKVKAKSTMIKYTMNNQKIVNAKAQIADSLSQRMEWIVREPMKLPLTKTFYIKEKSTLEARNCLILLHRQQRH